jgi:8-oxo-dGTP diphosphatase
MENALIVVAAVIEREGKILICRRRADAHHPLKWEFPGGKVEAGETPSVALARELEEELAVRAVIGPEIARYPYQYPGRSPILLIFFRVKEFEGEPVNREFLAILWEEPRNLLQYDFLEGDTRFIQLLARD